MRRAAAAALALALLAGCGGEPGGDADAYAKAGDAICRDYQAAIGKLGSPTELDDIGPYITRAMPVLRRTVQRVERLAPPDGLAAPFAEFRDHARQTLERAQALRDAAAKADAVEVQRLLDEAAKASRQRVELARAAGLGACAEI